MKITFFIYKLTTPSGKVYIGQTYNINRRFSSYRNLNCVKQVLIYNSIKKYGWENIKKEIIFDGVVSQSDIDKIESDFIKKYKSLGISLNICNETNSPSYRKGCLHHASKSVVKIDGNGKLLEEYDSITDASESVNGTPSCISKSCYSKNIKSYGFYWLFKDDYDSGILPDMTEFPHKSSKEIVQLSKNGEFIRTWESQSLASKELNISQGNMYRSLYGKCKFSGGYIWRFKEDYEKGVIIPKDKTRGNPISVHDKKGVLIGNFDSIKIAAETLGVNKTSIIRQLKGKTKKYNKYRYRYI